MSAATSFGTEEEDAELNAKVKRVTLKAQDLTPESFKDFGQVPAPFVASTGDSRSPFFLFLF